VAPAPELSEFARLAIELAAAHRPRWTRQGLYLRRRCSCGNPLPCRQLTALPTERSFGRTKDRTTSRAASRTDRATSRTDRATSRTDRTASRTDRATGRTDRATGRATDDKSG
jgi:hypothetical protein